MEIVTKCPKVLALASAHFISVTTFQDRTKGWNNRQPRQKDPVASRRGSEACSMDRLGLAFIQHSTLSKHKIEVKNVKWLSDHESGR